MPITKNTCAVFMLSVLLCLSTMASSSEGVNVSVRNALPVNSEIRMLCKNSKGEYIGWRVFGVGGEYRFSTESPIQYTYFCVADWGNMISEIKAVDPSSPAGDVFWNARADGLYLRAADGVTWTKMAVWQRRNG